MRRQWPSRRPIATKLVDGALRTTTLSATSSSSESLMLSLHPSVPSMDLAVGQLDAHPPVHRIGLIAFVMYLS